MRWLTSSAVFEQVVLIASMLIGRFGGALGKLLHTFSNQQSAIRNS